jgi:sugar phosphate isomerase/epimerase
MRIGVFAKTFPGSDPATVLRRAADAGFSAAQYNLASSGLSSMPDEIPAGTAEAIAAAAAQTGLEIAGVSGTYNMIHPDPAARERGHRRLDALALSCAAMGAPMITLCTGTRHPHDQWRGHRDNGSPEAWRDLLASMERAVAIAEAYGVDLGIEPELANVVSSAQKAHLLLGEIASSRLKIVLDPANLFERETPDGQRAIIAEAIDLLAAEIAMAHAKDRSATGDFAAAGKGIIDFPFFIGSLAKAGFTGPVVAHGLTAEEAPQVAAFLQRVVGEASPSFEQR